MSQYKFNVETLYDKTDHGLDIIKLYLSVCEGFDNALQNEKKHFKLRDGDQTASTVLVKPGKGLKGSIAVDYWRVKDFGGDFYTPIGIAMEYTGLDFYNCLKYLYEHFALDGSSTTFFKADTEVKTLDKADKRADGWFNVVVKDEYFALETIGPHITPELAKEYHFYSVDYYEKVFTKKDTGAKTYIKVTATESFPIFCYMPDKKWCKTYAPFSRDKNYKHGYLGKKPERFVHGLERLQREYDLNIASFDKAIQQAEQDQNEKAAFDLQMKRDNFKLPSVTICSGGSDGLNLASLLWWDVIWLNSESEQITYSEYKLLREICHEVYNLPDVDASGIKYGYQVAENFWTLKTVWLPQSKLGDKGKDFRDWMKYYRNASIETLQYQYSMLVMGALKMKFFERNHKTKSLKIKPSYLHYFLKVKGFFLYYPEKIYINKTADQEFIFIKITNNIVSQEFPNTIRKFVEKYLIDKGQPVEVIDLIKSTTQFTDKNLMSIDPIALEFKSFTADTQAFYFKNQFATIAADGIKLQSYKDCTSYVWRDKIIGYDVMPEKPFFEYTKDEAGNDRVQILRKDCEYMNFLINTSRTYWRKELEEQFAGKPESEKEAYHDANRFALNSDYLTFSENVTQEKHFLSKIFAIGYMLHKYKRKSFARMLYIMDDNEKDSETERNGGSGKSMILDGIDTILKNRFRIDGMSANLQSDRFMLDGVTKETDYILIEDLAGHYDITMWYNMITSSLSVNPKQKTPFEIGFFDAPKMAMTRNFGLKSLRSTLRRILFLSTSDYYHVLSEGYNEERRVAHDFGHDLFLWDSKSAQPSIHFAFLMECLKFYLQHRDNEIIAPQDNIDINNLKASMGDAFIEWCEGYFTETTTETVGPGLTETIHGTLNEYVLRSEMQDSYKNAAGKFAKTSANFKNSLKEYCKMRGWDFNPKDLRGSDGLIKKPYTDAKGKRQVLEHFYIRTNCTPVQPEPSTVDERKADPAQPQMNFDQEINTDDIDF